MQIGFEPRGSVTGRGALPLLSSMVILKNITKRKPTKKNVKVKVNFEIDMSLECFTYYDEYDKEHIAKNAIDAAANLELLAADTSSAHVLEYLIYESDCGTLLTDKWEVEILD